MPSKRFVIQKYSSGGNWVAVEWPYDPRETTNGPMDFNTLKAAEETVANNLSWMHPTVHNPVRIYDTQEERPATKANVAEADKDAKIAKFAKALEELQAFGQRNKQRAQMAYDDAELGSREELLAEARLHEANRIENVITYRVEEAKR